MKHRNFLLSVLVFLTMAGGVLAFFALQDKDSDKIDAQSPQGSASEGAEETLDEDLQTQATVLKNTETTSEQNESIDADTASENTKTEEGKDSEESDKKESDGEPGRAPILEAPAEKAAGEGDTYIVVLRSKPGDEDAQAINGSVIKQAEQSGAEVLSRMDSALVGFTAKLDDKTLGVLKANEHVAYIEQDQIVELSQESVIDEVEEKAESLSATEVEALGGATWGLDRIDQRDLPLDSNYESSGDGSGTNIYVLDTGILKSHREFGSRVKSGKSFVSGDSNPYGDGCHFHGTAVAGFAAGETVGPATNANLHSVKVLSCSGRSTGSSVIQGLDWVSQNAGERSIVNLSLGGSYRQTLVDVTNNLLDQNVIPVIAAGNSNIDACTTSPAAATRGITVGASNSSDSRANFSNWGSCVDLFAPGERVTSANNTNNTAYLTGSGTSYAAPYTAGVVSAHWGNNPDLSAEQVIADVLAVATPGVIQDVQGSPNKLVYGKVSKTDTEKPPSVNVSNLSLDAGSRVDETSGKIRFSADIGCDVTTAGYTLSVYDLDTNQLAHKSPFEGTVNCGSKLQQEVLVTTGHRYQAELSVAVIGQEYTYRSEVLAYDPQSQPSEPPSTSQILVRAYGNTGEEVMELEVNGEVVTKWNVSTSFGSYIYEPTSEVTSLRVLFNNDKYGGTFETDRNLAVDYAEVNGQRIETETVRSKGVWNGSCGEGYKKSQLLACNGWIEFIAL